MKREQEGEGKANTKQSTSFAFLILSVLNSTVYFKRYNIHSCKSNLVVHSLRVSST